MSRRWVKFEDAVVRVIVGKAPMSMRIFNRDEEEGRGWVVGEYTRRSAKGCCYSVSNVTKARNAFLRA